MFSFAKHNTCAVVTTKELTKMPQVSLDAKLGQVWLSRFPLAVKAGRLTRQKFFTGTLPPPAERHLKLVRKKNQIYLSQQIKAVA